METCGCVGCQTLPRSLSRTPRRATIRPSSSHFFHASCAKGVGSLPRLVSATGSRSKPRAALELVAVVLAAASSASTRDAPR